MLKTADLTIEKNGEGAWRIYALVNGFLECRRYYGYPRSEAIRRFKAEFTN